MKIIRRLAIVLIALGAYILFSQNEPDDDFGTVPFPGAGLSVKMLGKIKSEGNYFLSVAMPETNENIAMGEETLPCAISVRFTRSNGEHVDSEVKSLRLSSEFGFAKLQFYKGGNWALKSGKYDIEIKCAEECKAATLRGAMISLGKETTEHLLLDMLLAWSGMLFFATGLILLILCEFKKVP